MQMEPLYGISGAETKSKPKINAVGWVASVVILLLLWQYRPIQPLLTWLSIIIVLGLLLRAYPTIQQQFNIILGK